MYVSLYSAYTDNSGYITHGICSLRYLGDAVWEYEAIDEYDSYLAVIKNQEGRIFAKTPVVKFVDGKLVEVEDDHIFDRVLNLK